MPVSLHSQAAVCGVWVELAQAKYWRRGPYPDSLALWWRASTKWALRKLAVLGSLGSAIGKPARRLAAQSSLRRAIGTAAFLNEPGREGFE